MNFSCDISFYNLYKMILNLSIVLFYKKYCMTWNIFMLQNLFETQFDCNNKFKEKINEKSAQDLRSLPLGRDKDGLAYWYILVSFLACMG